jgi:hypothetical protein
VDFSKKTLYFLIPTRSKFVGAHVTNIIQQKTGIVYGIENVDQQSKSTGFFQTLAAIEA